MKLLTKQEKADFVETFRTIQLGAPGKVTSYSKFYENEHEYIELDNGAVIMWDKPSILSTIYYDDETADPLAKNKKEVWMAENLNRNFTDYQLYRWIKEMQEWKANGFATGTIELEPYFTISENHNSFMQAYPVFYNGRASKEEDKKNGSPISEKECDELVKILDELKAQYIKRLETYYKKYEDKICSVGYWANR